MNRWSKTKFTLGGLSFKRSCFINWISIFLFSLVWNVKSSLMNIFVPFSFVRALSIRSLSLAKVKRAMIGWLCVLFVLSLCTRSNCIADTLISGSKCCVNVWRSVPSQSPLVSSTGMPWNIKLFRLEKPSRVLILTSHEESFFCWFCCSSSLETLCFSYEHFILRSCSCITRPKLSLLSFVFFVC